MNLKTKTHLYKYIKESCNFTQCEITKLLNNSQILVNGKKERLTYVVKDEDIVTVNNEVVKRKEYVYYLYNKPVGVVCTNCKEVNSSIIKSINVDRRVFCVGRLDKESSGLMILTNDGMFFHKLINGKNSVEKEYIVKLKDIIEPSLCDEMEKPIEIRGHLTSKARVDIINFNTLRVIISEGKYHQIRRLVIRAKNSVVSLERVRIGEYMIGDLKPGELRQFYPKI